MMNRIKTIFVVFLLLSFPHIMNAQDDHDFYLQKAKQRLAEGDCDGAQKSYDVYKTLNGTNRTIELEIADCLSAIKAKYEAADNLDKAQECLKKGECSSAERYYSQYKKAFNVSDFELERQINDCLSQKKAEEEAALLNAEGVGYYNSGDYGQAAKAFLNAAKEGNMYAQYNLGLLYEVGLGVDKNIEKAKLWYQKAANQGHGDATNRLSELNRKKYVVGELIRIGDKPYYVAYVDYSGYHGWAFYPRPIADNRLYVRDYSESSPTIDELQTIYDNRYRINCSYPGWTTAEYWSSSYVNGKYYTLDFSTGKTKTRKKTDRYCHIFIRKF